MNPYRICATTTKPYNLLKHLIKFIRTIIADIYHIESVKTTIMTASLLITVLLVVFIAPGIIAYSCGIIVWCILHWFVSILEFSWFCPPIQNYIRCPATGWQVFSILLIAINIFLCHSIIKCKRFLIPYLSKVWNLTK